MSSKPFVITGCKSPAGVHSRLEIRDLQQNDLQFSLFVRALNNVMKLDYKFDGTDAVNWEQLGGIHGMPYQEWSGDVNEQPVPGNPWEGYCYHRDPLFPTWHRIVLLLVEQAIWQEANKIAATYQGDEAEEWKKAALALRLPFWDWTTPVTEDQAAGQVPYFPDIFTKPEVRILLSRGDGGIQSQWDDHAKNPLHTYNFGDIHKTFPNYDGSYFKSWDRTYRWPTDVTTNPKEQYDLLNNALVNGGPGSRQNPVRWLRDRVAHLFTYKVGMKQYGGNMWDYFSNVRYDKNDPSGYAPHQSDAPYWPMPPAIEEPHDSVHLDVGDSGHMGDNDVAGFDPIFYLHHCNIDRIYAFWEYVYPEYWLGNGWTRRGSDGSTSHENFISVYGNFTNKAGSVINEDSPLTPFRKSETEYWTSRDIHGLQHHKNLYYTYPPIKDGPITVKVDEPLPLLKRRRYIRALQRHWGLARDAPLRRMPTVDAPIFHQSPLTRAPAEGVPPPPSLPDEYEAYEKMKIFVIRVSVPEHNYKGSFSVELRPVAAPDVIVNKVSFLRRGDSGHCGACRAREASNTGASGTMILDSTEIRELLEGAGLNEEGASDEDVIKLIRTTFFARVVAPGGKVLAEGYPESSRLANNSKLLSKSGIPRLTFYSASVAHHTDGDDGDIQFFDWNPHTEILGKHWADLRDW